VIVLIVYMWTILWFFWKLPSWLFFLNITEIINTSTYAFATNFAESLLVLIALLILSLALPITWFHDVFVARGSSLAVATLGYMIFLGNQFKSKIDYPAVPLKIWSVPLTLAGIVLLVFLSGRISILRKTFEFLSDRAIVFLFITIPLSIISVVLILFRSMI